MNSFHWLEIAFPLSLDQTFSYTIPEELLDCVEVGQRVIAPLGHRNQQGMVVALLDSEPSDLKQPLKEISALVDPVPIFDHDLIQVLKWISRYYFTPLGKVLQMAVPADARLQKDVLVQATEDLNVQDELSTFLADRAVARLSSLKRRFGTEDTVRAVARLQRAGQVELENEFKGRGERVADWLVFPSLDKEPEISPRAATQQRIWEFLNDFPAGIPLTELILELGCTRDPVKRLEERGLVNLEPIPPDLDPLKDYHRPPPKTVQLNAEQQVAFDAIATVLDAGEYRPYLLFGVPGSGKTEVYLETAARAIEQGKSVIILVPEIALAPQIAHRFQSRFGEVVALWHSNLRGPERLWTWQQIQKGRARIVVGARSAILTPVQNLGLIIVDEEQEHSYKQEDTEPRYHARDVALVRGREEQAVVILGSATPSLETYYNLNNQRYEGLYLNQRWEEAQNPEVEVVDMNTELEDSEDYQNPLSRSLVKAMETTLADDKQIILFQNRRGYSPVVRCKDCGWIMECPHDGITLTFHKYGNKMRCHYCDHQAPPPAICPACQSLDLHFGGTGTQKIEEVLGEKFPDVPVIRMDMDTTRGKGAHQKLLGEFARGNGQILLGTQMIAKGLDFERVTLVGVVNADAGLHYPDFRARERTFQLVYQVSGRSGRGIYPGRVVIQTWLPEDLAIKSATQRNLKQFYNLELSDRNQLNYPPFARIASLGFLGRDRDRVVQAVDAAAARLRKVQDIQLLGPSPALIERTPRGYYWKIILKSSKTSDAMGVKLRQAVAGISRGWKNRDVRLSVDMDPYQLL